MEKIPEPNNEKLESYKHKLNELYHEALESPDNEAFHNFTEKLHEKVTYLRKKHGKSIEDYAWYHMLVHSSLREAGSAIQDDFSGEDSIADFIDSLQV